MGYLAVLVAVHEIEVDVAKEVIVIHPLDDQSRPPVLDYGTAQPRRPWRLIARDWLEEGIDQLGGPTMACLVFMLLFLGLGLRVGGPIGSASVMTAGVFFQIGLGCWAKSSRW